MVDALAAVDTPAVLAGFALLTAAVGGFVAFRKAKPEMTSIEVSSLRDALSAQAGVITGLQNELERTARIYVASLADRDRTIGRLEARIEKLERANGDPPAPSSSSISAR